MEYGPSTPPPPPSACSKTRRTLVLNSAKMSTADSGEDGRVDVNEGGAEEFAEAGKGVAAARAASAEVKKCGLNVTRSSSSSSSSGESATKMLSLAMVSLQAKSTSGEEGADFTGVIMVTSSSSSSTTGPGADASLRYSGRMSPMALAHSSTCS